MTVEAMAATVVPLDDISVYYIAGSLFAEGTYMSERFKAEVDESSSPFWPSSTSRLPFL